jgi:hypothetical protein
VTYQSFLGLLVAAGPLLAKRTTLSATRGMEIAWDSPGRASGVESAINGRFNRARTHFFEFTAFSDQG